MKKDWDVKSFGEVCEIIGGSQPPKSNFIYEPKLGYVRLIQVRDYKTDKYITYIPKNSTKKFCTEDDIMIGRYGPPIFGIFRGLKGAYNVALMKAVPNEELLDKEFLFWFLKNDNLLKYIEKTSKRAAGQDGVRKERLYSYPIPIPPLPEQKRIVEILDEAFEAIEQAKANVERNIQNAEELFQSKLNEIFSQKGEGWVEKRLSDLIELISGQHINSKDYNNDGKGIGYLTGPSDFGENHPSVTKWTEHPKRKASMGDILITVKGSGIGSVNLLDIEEVAISRQLMAIRSKEVATKYLYSYLKIQYDKIQSLGNGAAIPGISRDDVLNLKISIPSNASQENIVNQITLLEEHKLGLVAIYLSKIKNLEELKKSILQKAFSGELTANEELAV